MAGRFQPYPAARIGEPGGSINAALRSVRRASGVSLDVLAARTNFSKPYLSNVEGGRRRVTPEMAQAYDAALGTGGLLVRLLAGGPDAPVGRAAGRPRRALVRLGTGPARRRRPPVGRRHEPVGVGPAAPAGAAAAAARGWGVPAGTAPARVGGDRAYRHRERQPGPAPRPATCGGGHRADRVPRRRAGRTGIARRRRPGRRQPPVPARAGRGAGP